MVKPARHQPATVTHKDVTVKKVNVELWREARRVQIESGLTMSTMLEQALRDYMYRR